MTAMNLKAYINDGKYYYNYLPDRRPTYFALFKGTFPMVCVHMYNNTCIHKLLGREKSIEQKRTEYNRITI